MSPQIVARKKAYSITSSDIFASGVVLFNMVCGHMAFFQASKDDAYYKCIYKKRQDLFWKAHDSRMKEKGKEPVSPALKQLLDQLLSRQEKDRPNFN